MICTLEAAFRFVSHTKLLQKTWNIAKKLYGLLLWRFYDFWK